MINDFLNASQFVQHIQLNELSGLFKFSENPLKKICFMFHSHTFRMRQLAQITFL